MSYASAQRAAEDSRTGRALSCQRFRVMYEGRPVMAQILYEKGDYKLTFAGLPLTSVRGTPYFSLIDNCKEWRPM